MRYAADCDGWDVHEESHFAEVLDWPIRSMNVDDWISVRGAPCFKITWGYA